MRIIVHSVLFIFLVAVSIYAIFAQSISHDGTDNTINIFSVGRSFPDSVPASEIEYLGSPYPEREQGKVGDGTTREHGTSPEYTGILPSQYPRENTGNIAMFPKIAPDNDGSLREEEAIPYKVPTYATNARNNEVVHNIPSIIYPPSEIVDNINDTASIAEYRSVLEEVDTPERMAGMKDLEDQEESKEVEIQNPTLVPFVSNGGYEAVETTPRTPPEATAEIAIPRSLPEAEVYAQHESGNEGSTVIPTASYPEDYTHVAVPEELPDSEYVYDEDSIIAQEPEDETYNPLMQRNNEDVTVVAQLMQGQFIQIASSKDLSQTKVLYNSVNLQLDSALAINNLIRIWKHPSSEYFRLVIGPFNPSDIGLQLYTWRQYFSDAFTYSPSDASE